MKIELEFNESFNNKSFSQIMNDLNLKNEQKSLLNQLDCRTKLDLNTCINYGKKCNIKNCLLCSLLLLLENKDKLRSRNINSWKKGSNNNKKIFNEKKLYHYHLINNEEYSTPNNYIFINGIKQIDSKIPYRDTPLDKENDGYHVSDYYVLYTEKKKTKIKIIYEILLICRHPTLNNHNQWNALGNYFNKM